MTVIFLAVGTRAEFLDRPACLNRKNCKSLRGVDFHNSFFRLSRIICAFLLRTLIFYNFLVDPTLFFCGVAVVRGRAWENGEWFHHSMPASTARASDTQRFHRSVQGFSARPAVRERVLAGFPLPKYSQPCLPTAQATAANASVAKRPIPGVHCQGGHCHAPNARVSTARRALPGRSVHFYHPLPTAHRR